MKARFIAIEGPDGAGKSTLARGLAEALRAAGRSVEPTAEPTHGVVGQMLRTSMDTLAPEVLPFLFAADRAEHVAGVINVALAQGRDVICDRYVLSSLAYQGLSGDARLVWQLNQHFPMPDVTLILYVRPELALARLRNRGTLTSWEVARAPRLGAAYFEADQLAATWPTLWLDAGVSADALLRAALDGLRDCNLLPAEAG